MRLGAGARGRGGARAVLEGLHPGHRADRSGGPRSSSSRGSSRPPCRRWSTAPATSTSACGDLRRGRGPTVIVEDNVVAFPAAPGGRRALGPHRLLQPAGAARTRTLPPPSPAIRLDDRSAGGRTSARSTDRPAGRHPRRLRRVLPRARGAPPLPDLEFIHESPLAQPLRLSRGGRLRRGRARWARPGRTLEASVRATDEPGTLPGARRAEGDGALVYLSLGSLGSADVGLMQRLIDALGGTRHRVVVVASGPQHELQRLADNMVGAEFLPQTSDPARGRPGHHPRRQQHGHRVACTSASRWSCSRCSGTSTTTPSGCDELGLGVAPGDLRLDDRRAARPRSTACSPTRRCGAARRLLATAPGQPGHRPRRRAHRGARGSLKRGFATPVRAGASASNGGR